VGSGGARGFDPVVIEGQDIVDFVGDTFMRTMFVLMCIVLLAIFGGGCGSGNASIPSDGAPPVSNVTGDTAVLDVIDNLAFDGFGRFIFPVGRGLPNSGMKISNIGTLLPYHNNIDTDTTVGVINYMLDEVRKGQTIFYDIYSTGEKQANPSKEDTGLFFFSGEPGAPFAIVCAGGGFSYVGSIHESFPLGLELSKNGYNAFAIQYRTGGAEVACADLAAALSFIFKNTDMLNVSTKDYSLWGGSAGARMAAYLGSYGTAAYGGDDLPKPAAVIMQYTGHSDYTANDPPTYACIGDNDSIASPQAMERRINALKAIGIDTEFHIYPNLGHGFGLGIGTSAAGWADDAVAFWEGHMTQTTPVTDSQPIPLELESIPGEYYQVAKRQGTLLEFTYNTYKSNTYELKKNGADKAGNCIPPIWVHGRRRLQ
jgi:acetyl esterase/lipase